MIIYQVK